MKIIVQILGGVQMKRIARQMLSKTAEVAWVKINAMEDICVVCDEDID